MNVEAQSTDAQPQHESLCCVRSHAACNVNSPRACAAWQGEGARRDEATPVRVLLSLSCFLSCTQPESDGRVAAAPIAKASTSAAVCCCEPTAAASWKDKNSHAARPPQQPLQAMVVGTAVFSPIWPCGQKARVFLEKLGILSHRGKNVKTHHTATANGANVLEKKAL